MDTDLDHEKVFWNEFVCLGLRVDTWVVPKPLLVAHLRTAEEAILEKKGIDKLGRQAKTELKAMVLRKLRKQLVPVTRAVDLVWNVNTGVARFFSQSPKIHALAQELFEKTFRLSMVPESPGTAAERRGMDARAQKIWDRWYRRSSGSQSADRGGIVKPEPARARLFTSPSASSATACRSRFYGSTRAGLETNSPEGRGPWRCGSRPAWCSPSRRKRRC
jgi:hypothetical protein